MRGLWQYTGTTSKSYKKHGITANPGDICDFTYLGGNPPDDGLWADAGSSVGVTKVATPASESPGSGLLAAMPAAGSGTKGFYTATDGGPAVYQDLTPGVPLTQVAAPPTGFSRGVIGSVKLTTNLGVSVQVGTLTDLLAGNAANVQFLYTGRPVKIGVRLSRLTFSVVNSALQLRFVDASGAGVATNGKDLYEEPLCMGGLTPASAATLFNSAAESPPMQTAADNTAMVAGTTYTWKAQVYGVAGNLVSSWAAGTRLFGSIYVIEL